MIKGRPITRASFNKTLLTLMFTVSACSTPGCIIPMVHRPIREGREAPVTDSENLARLIAMPRADLLLQLGEPDWTTKGGTVHVYSWRVLEAVVVLIVSPQNIGGVEITSSQLLLVEYDAGWRASRIERTCARPLQTTEQRVEEWISSTAGGK